MTDTGTISTLTTLVTFVFASIIVGGIVIYLALASRKKEN
jgi:hypothetical protein